MTTQELLTAYREYLADGIRPTEILMCSPECGGFAKVSIKNSKAIKQGWVEAASSELENGEYLTFGHSHDPIYVA